MDVDLRDLITGQLTGDVIRQIGEAVDLDEDRTRSALDGLVPAVIGGFVREASTPSGLGRLSHALDEADESMLDDAVGLIGGDRRRLFDVSQKLAGGLFGPSEQEVTTAVGRSTGVNAKTIANLLKIVGPLVAAFLARQKKQKKLDDRGLGDLLESQRPRVEDALPKDVRDAIGLGDRRAPRRAEARPRGGCLRRLMPLLLVCLVAFLAWKMCSGAPPSEEPSSPPPQAEAAPEDVLGAALQSVQRALTGATSLADVQRAIPVLERATAELNGLIRGLDSMSAEQRALLGGVAKAIGPKIGEWVSGVAEIPGASDLIAKPLLEFGQAVDTLAENA